MFGRFSKEFDEDPFFSGFGGQRDFFGPMGRFHEPFMELPDGNRSSNRRNTDRQVADPFGGIFQSMDSMMADMQRRMSDLETKSSGDPHVHSFTSSNVMTYVNDGKSKPKYYQASTSTRRAPGNIKETRRTLRDSETGIDKMAVGHHIGDKGRVIEKRRNKKNGGAIEEEKNYFHMGEEDEHAFEDEWRRRTTSYNVDYGKPSRSTAAQARGIAAPVKQSKKRYDKTPAVAVHGNHIEPTRPHGPSKSGRTRSRY